MSKQPVLKVSTAGKSPADEIDVGQRLRELRAGRGLSLRALAELSGLNVNTLSLIENRRTSPSVSTLQQLAQTLQVPLSAFFETNHIDKLVVHQKAGNRPLAAFTHGSIEDLGAGCPASGQNRSLSRSHQKLIAVRPPLSTPDANSSIVWKGTLLTPWIPIHIYLSQATACSLKPICRIIGRTWIPPPPATCWFFARWMSAITQPSGIFQNKP